MTEDIQEAGSKWQSWQLCFLNSNNYRYKVKMDLRYNLFVNNLYYYLTKKQTEYNAGIIRKHTKNLSANGDVSFPLKLIHWKSILLDENSVVSEENILNENDCKTLLKISEEWTLKVEKYIFDKTNVLLYLNRIFCIGAVLNDILINPNQYGYRINVQPKTYSLQTSIEYSEKIAELNLSDLRVVLTKKFADSLIRNCGQKIDTVESEQEIVYKLNFSNNSKKDKTSEIINILCGPVVDCQTGKKCSITANEFYTKRQTDMRLLAEHKYGVRIRSVPSWQEMFIDLGNASVVMEMLQVKPSSLLRININDPSDSNNKGASFVLYNCARMAQIIKKFEKQISEGKCNLPDINQIDVNLLNEPEEWDLVYNYLLHFPIVIKNCINDLDSGKINPQYLCSFLFGLCSKFSVYYRRVKILTCPTREHLLPTMYARIYLLKTIEIVLHNALTLLNIKPITQM